jgi:hypothetical protein
MVLLKSILQALPTYIFTTLVAPKSVIQAIRNIHCNFIWNGHHLDKKWALVGWDKLCKTKSLGGLELRDPEKINQVVGAKMWWRWLKHPTILWAQILKQKYALTTRAEQLIRFNDQIQGSNIWNMTWLNRQLV